MMECVTEPGVEALAGEEASTIVTHRLQGGGAPLAEEDAVPPTLLGGSAPLAEEDAVPPTVGGTAYSSTYLALRP